MKIIKFLKRFEKEQKSYNQSMLKRNEKLLKKGFTI